MTHYKSFFPIFSHHLKNGLTVHLIEDHQLPVICYHTTFRTGSRNEFQDSDNQAGITGISHLFEHMMFNGSVKYGAGEFDKLLESRGGYSNAWTSKDLTAFYEVFPSNQLELVADMEADRMAHLDLSEKMFQSEKQVVMEEHRMSIENSIAGTMWQMLYQNAFSCHPYQWPVIGRMEDLKNITLSDCCQYYQKYYSPSNAVITIAGDIRAEDAISLVESKYQGIQASEFTEPNRNIEPLHVGERFVELNKAAEIESWLIGYLCCDGQNPDVPALDILQQVLLNGNSSRLVHRLVHNTTLCLDVSGAFNWGIDPNLFYFSFRVQPGKSGEQALSQFTEQIDQIISHTISKRELDKAKNQLFSEMIHESATLMGKCSEISNYSIIFNNPDLVFDMADRYAEVSLADVQSVAEKYLTSDNRTIIRLIPGSK